MTAAGIPPLRMAILAQAGRAKVAHATKVQIRDTLVLELLCLLGLQDSVLKERVSMGSPGVPLGYVQLS